MPYAEDAVRLMKMLPIQPKLVEQVYEAILLEVAEGKLPLGSRVIQEQLAADFGVSRQPVQQALLLLRNQGILRDAPGRGLIVAPMDLDYVQNLYEIRAVLEGFACRKAAELNAERARKDGPALIEAGREAVRSGSIGRMIAADVKFHEFVYELAENPLISHATESNWIYMRRVMGEVLMRDERPRDIWNQHAQVLEAIMAGDADAAEQHTRQHVLQAANFMIARLRTEAAPKQTDHVSPRAPGHLVDGSDAAAVGNSLPDRTPDHPLPVSVRRPRRARRRIA